MLPERWRLRGGPGTWVSMSLVFGLMACSDDTTTPSPQRQSDPNVGVVYTLISVNDLPLPQVVELVDTLRTVVSGTLQVSAQTGITICGVEGTHWPVTERHKYEGTGLEETAWPGLGGYLIGPTNNNLVSVGLDVACNWSRTTIRGDTFVVSRDGSDLRYEAR